MSEIREAKLEKNSSTLFTTETRSTRRCAENPDASVKSPCPPCLRGETGHVAAAGRPSGKVLRPQWVSRPADGTFCRFVSDARGSHECKSASWKYPHVPTSSVRSEGRPRSPADGWQRNAGQHEA